MASRSARASPRATTRPTLVAFLSALKRGEPEVSAPVYSHVRYDILEGEEQVLRSPDVVIVEGLNVLQTSRGVAHATSRTSSTSRIYVDAQEQDIERWFLDRFFTLRETVFADPESFFHAYASMDEQQAEAFARMVWSTINGVQPPRGDPADTRPSTTRAREGTGPPRPPRPPPPLTGSGGRMLVRRGPWGPRRPEVRRDGASG